MNFISGPKTSRKLKEIYGRLLTFFGPQKWWPGETPFEVTLGAILTQNTAWTNVEKAIRNIRTNGRLHLAGLSKLGEERLAELIRPSGFFNVKSKRLKEWFGFLRSHGCKRDLRALERIPTEELRKKLISVKGIGPETADSILLYALERPIFVVDAYTKRIFSRHGFVSGTADYHEVQDLFTRNLKPSVNLFNEYHALLVALGKEYCRPKPKCDSCPLNYLFGPKKSSWKRALRPIMDKKKLFKKTF